MVVDKEARRLLPLSVFGAALLLSILACQQPKETVQVGYKGEFSNRISIDDTAYNFKLEVEMSGRLRLRKDRYEMWVGTDLFYPNITDSVTLDASKLSLRLNGIPMIYLGKKGGWNINPVDGTKRFSHVYEFTTPEMTEVQMDRLLSYRHEFVLDLGCFVNINEKCVSFDSVIAIDPNILP